MAINKKLIHFKSKQKFEEELAKGSILDTSIVFIQDSKEIWTHGNLFNCSDKHITDEILSEYATKEYISQEIDKISSSGEALITDVQVNGESVLTDKVANIDLSNYVTEQWITDQNFLTEHQDISQLATKSELPTKVSDLDNDSNFITISDIPSLDQYVTETELSQKGYLTDHQDISHLAEKSEIPSLEGYVTETALNEKGYLTEHQSLDNYYTKDEINQQLGDINSILESIING